MHKLFGRQTVALLKEAQNGLIVLQGVSLSVSLAD